MRFEEQFSPDERELLNEELTDSEVREILDRLSVAELGGSEKATVGAVCEATGVGPRVVGRMLAEIRQTNLHELFGHRIDSHEQKISKLEQTVTTLKRESQRKETPAYQTMSHTRPRVTPKKKENSPMILIGLVGFSIYILLMMALVSPPSTAPASKFDKVSRVPVTQAVESVVLPYGRTIKYDPAVNKVFVYIDDGKFRPASPIEAEKAFGKKAFDFSEYSTSPPKSVVMSGTEKIVFFEKTSECYIVNIESFFDRLPTRDEVKEYFPEFVDKVRMIAEDTE
ncbi:MAG: hypothetical protein KDC26_08385 [Armatimonadetes bacterium]|nr:hypothetical protein [Armatimonadota bacterium]